MQMQDVMDVVTAGGAVPRNPFRHDAVWRLGGGVPQLCGATPGPATSPPGFPMLLTGVHGCGTEATIDLLASQATELAWAVVRCDATPERPLLASLCDAVDGTVASLVARHGDGPGTRGLQLAAARLRSVRSLGDGAADALVALAGEAATGQAGLFVTVEHLHAATRDESDALLRALAAMAAHAEIARAVVTATNAQCVGTDRSTRAAWIDVPLVATRDQVGQVLAEAHRERTFDLDAVEAVHRLCGGVAELALAHAAAAWDATSAPTIGVAAVAAGIRPAAAHWTAALRERWAPQLSLGRRRYLQSLHGVAGTEWAVVDDVHSRITTATRFAPSPSALESMLDGLVRDGLVVVQDGYVRLAVRGIAAIL